MYAPQGMYDPNGQSKATRHILYAVLTFFFCPVHILSIVHLIFALLAQQSYTSGDVISGEQYLRYAKMCLIANVVAFGLVWGLVIAVVVFGVGIMLLSFIPLFFIGAS